MCQGRRPLLRITAVETIHTRYVLSRPTGPAGAFNAARQALIVKVSTDAGLVGWGETYALAGVRAALESLKPLLIGQDPLQRGRLWQSAYDATFGNGFALGGIDIALHDLIGKALGVPVHQLYGGARRGRVPIYASGMCYFPETDPASYWVEEAQDLLQRGFTQGIKMRIGRYPPEHELPLIAQVRQALPATARLMVDAWGSYTLPTALTVGAALHRLGLHWFEEPLPQAGYASYPELTQQLSIAVAGGEMLQSRSDFKTLFERRAVDLVQPDICICGGIAEVLFVADLARLSGIQCAPHSWNGQIMNAATLHVASVLAEPTRVEGNATPMLEFDTTENPCMTEELVEPFDLRDGCFEVPMAPGLGIEIDEERIRAAAVDE